MPIYAVFGPLFLGLGVIAVFIAKSLKKGLVSGSISSDTLEVLEIKVPRIDDDTLRNVQASPLCAENMFSTLHGLLTEEDIDQEHFSFEVVAMGEGGIKFYAGVPRKISGYVESQIYAQYPSALIDRVADYTPVFNEAEHYEIVNLELAKPEFFPLKSFMDLEVDPLSGITSVLSNVAESDLMGIQLVMKPAPDIWQAEGYKYTDSVRAGVSYGRTSGAAEVKKISSSLLTEVKNILVEVLTGFFRSSEEAKLPYKSPTPVPVKLSPTQDLELKSVENKLSKLGYFVQLRIFSSSGNPQTAIDNMRSVVATMKQFYSATTNSFVSKHPASKSQELDHFIGRYFDARKAYVLNVEELAAVYHLPSATISTPNMSSWIYSKKSEPPSSLPTKDCTYIGDTIYRNKRIRFGIKDGEDRLRHMYLIGKSGTGKSTLLESMASQDIAKGFGVGLLDPHGETIDKILDRIPDDRIDDVVVVDPSDSSCPVGINLLELDDPDQKNLMTSALVAAIKHHFDYSWGPRLEYLLNYAILTLLEAPGSTMLGITRLLEDQNYLNYVLHFVKDPVILKFWNTEYKAMKGNNKLVTEAIAPIQNKVNRFLASTTIRNILGQQKSTIDIWDIMNSGKVLLMNLSKGKIGEDNANLLGALLVSRIQFMALQRAKIPPDDRRPFYLYVDEFQNFATGSFESILSESRKYKLGLYLTHQYTAQLPEELLEAVLGNVGTIASFSLGAPDALSMANEFAPFFDRNDLISLERFHAYIKLMIDGMTSMPFSAKILLPWEKETEIVPLSGNKAKVLERSREKYGIPVEKVTAEINAWAETQYDKGKAIAMTATAVSKEDPGRVVSEPNGEAGFSGTGEIVLQDVGDLIEGEVCEGTVVDIAGFGAFVEIRPGVKGLVHISEMSEEFVKKTEDVVSKGDTVMVKVLSVGADGKIKLSMKGIDQKVVSEGR